MFIISAIFFLVGRLLARRGCGGGGACWFFQAPSPRCVTEYDCLNTDFQAGGRQFKGKPHLKLKKLQVTTAEVLRMKLV